MKWLSGRFIMALSCVIFIDEKSKKKKLMKQCCNEDWNWTKYEYEDSSVSENRPKTNTKIFEEFANLQRSSKIQRFSEENEKFLLLKIVFQTAT